MPKVEMPKGNEPPKKMPTGVEAPLNPLGLEPAPKAIPKVTVETEKSPF
jgi:hypothetical protein